MRKEYKKSRQNAKRVISSAKEKKQKECANDLNDSECQNEIFRMAKQMVKERQDITGLNSIKEASGIVDDKGIKDSRKHYTEKLTNEGMNGIIRHWLGLRKDQQIASGFLK